MSSIKTYTGVMFDPLNPESELIDILDIAHALSMLCRANGHFRNFYSVGQHCIKKTFSKTFRCVILTLRNGRRCVYAF